RRGLVDSLAEHDGFGAAASGRHAGALLAGRANRVLKAEALDRAFASEGGLGALAGDLGAVGVEEQVDGLCHDGVWFSFRSMMTALAKSKWCASPRLDNTGGLEGGWVENRTELLSLGGSKIEPV